MAYSMQPGYNCSLYIFDESKKYYAGYDYLYIRELVDKLNKAHRPNLEEREDGLYVCWGGHARCQPCKWEQLVEYHKYSGRKPDQGLSGTTLDGGATSVAAIDEIGQFSFDEKRFESLLEEFNKQPIQFGSSSKPPTGWICPVCKAGLSPTVTRCSCTDDKQNKKCSYNLDTQSSF